MSILFTANAKIIVKIFSQQTAPDYDQDNGSIQFDLDLNESWKGRMPPPQKAPTHLNENPMMEKNFHQNTTRLFFFLNFHEVKIHFVMLQNSLG